MEPTPEQIDAFRRDGFLVVERFLDADEVHRLRERFGACFAHEFETGLRPDEVNYDPKSTQPDLTSQLCNAWKADRTIAATVLARRNAEIGAKLAGVPGLRLAPDKLIWKPPSGKALLCHQDAAYLDHLAPPNMTTCWMALDDTSADTGTIYYVKGSNHWPHAELGGSFPAPDDWLAHVRDKMPGGAELELVPIEVPAGGAAFHDGWTFHGSPPNESGDAERRAIISHMVSTETRWSDGTPHAIYSRYRRPGERELDEAFFPVLWRADGHRTASIDAEFAALRSGVSVSAV